MERQELRGEEVSERERKEKTGDKIERQGE